MILPILRTGPGMCFDCSSRIQFGHGVPTETAGKQTDELAATGDRRYVADSAALFQAPVALMAEVPGIVEKHGVLSDIGREIANPL